jgi:arsenate reductase
MEPLTVYLHPSCSKSAAAGALLDSRGADFVAVDYVQSPPGAETIGHIVDMLEGAPAELVRVDDARFAELGLDAADVGDRDSVIAVLMAHPDLMQRPVVVGGGRAIVARPPELLLALLD